MFGFVIEYKDSWVQPRWMIVETRNVAVSHRRNLSEVG